MSDLKNVMAWVGRSGKRIAVSVVGFALILTGIGASFVPGVPGIVLVIAGLAVLGTEYAWARSALKETKKQAGRFRDRLKRKKK